MRTKLGVVLALVTTMFVAPEPPIQGATKLPSGRCQSVAEPQAGGPVMDGLQLLLDSPKTSFASDERIEVTLHLKNLGRQRRTLYWQNAPWYRNFTMMITDALGNSVPRELEPSEKDPLVLSQLLRIIPMPIQSGQEFREGLADLKEYFALLPGHTYFVTAARTLPKADGSGVVEVISNTVRVKLAAGAPSPQVSVGGPSRGGGEVADGARLSISAGNGAFSAAEPVSLVLGLKNLRHGVIAKGWDGGPWYWYANNISLKVVDASGIAVARIPDELETETPANRPLTSYDEFQIGPGQEMRVPIPDLRKYFELKPGNTYFVTATWNVKKSSGEGSVEVTSNAISVKLLGH